jgi:hypothetical protein
VNFAGLIAKNHLTFPQNFRKIKNPGQPPVSDEPGGQARAFATGYLLFALAGSSR